MANNNEANNEATTMPAEHDLDQVSQSVRLAIVCDLDGTLALHTSRGPFDWGRVITDEPNRPVVRLVRRYARDHMIVIVSGRSDVAAEDTMAWLEREGVPWHFLYMREHGDNRPDDIVKREMYDNHIRDQYEIEFVLDDRDRVVRLWRSLGLTCFQVAPGDF